MGQAANIVLNDSKKVIVALYDLEIIDMRHSQAF